MRASLLKFFYYFLSTLSLRTAHAVGGAIGWLFAVIPNKRRRTAQINLRLCFPSMGKTPRARLARKNLIEFGKTAAEVAVHWARDAEQFNSLVKKVSGEELLKNALRRGKGVILAMPHMGAWEFMGLYCSQRYPLTVMFRPLPMSEFGNIMFAARQRFGARMASGDGNGVRTLYRALGKGEVVAILPDQVPPSRSGTVFAPFFGIRASTMVLLSRLAIKTQAPVIFAYAERLPRGEGYHLHFLSGHAGINDGNLEHSATLVNAMVEHCARELPEQYQWVYKRFRNRPKGEVAYY